ncbi:hypothetical protein BDN71DRAFT_1585905 [Pleurotus eryngii]|uniref:TOG domain-containing protein n=1 Tax=Pleurotus eryngii TaxID=5323 RepID=A0A9P6DD48_PLEER|nr:hypothetical protein BDN71DRAFT_1585905 [Pleurotus eryngii]
MFKRQVDDALGTALTTPETEETWDKIAKAIDSLAKLFEDGNYEDPSEGQAVMRMYSRPIINAMNSERGRLSGPAINLVGVAASILGTDFETILSTYLPPLLVLCGRTNKVVLNRARTCIRSIIENTQLPGILPILMHDAQDKSVTLRLVVAESILACLSILNPPDLEREVRAKEIESSIRFAANDASADVRKVGKQLFAAYQVLLPDRVERFSAPLSPTIKKCLGITSKAQAPRSRSPSHSRPQSSRSVHSNRDHHEPPAPVAKAKTRSTKTEEAHSSHQRSTSTHVLTQQTVEHAGLSKSGPSRLRAERPVKDSMPPPEFIPVRPGAPSRQPSSSSLNGSRSTSTRPAPQPSIAGPFRPEKSQPASLRLVQTKDSTATEKHAMPGGPRRVMLPDPDPETLEKAKAKSASNNAASTSVAITQSVPAVKAQAFAPLKRTMSRAQLNTKVTEKPKPVIAVAKITASSTTSKALEKTAKLNKAPEAATTAPSVPKINAAAIKGKGLTAPTIAQASKMKAAVEKKPAASTSTTKPTWGGRSAPPKKPQPAPAATKAVTRKPPIPPRTGQLPRPIKVNPTLVPLPPSPKAGAKKLKPSVSKASIKEQQPVRTPTPTLISLPASPSPAPSTSPTPDVPIAEPTDADDAELVVHEEEPQQTTTAPAEDPAVAEERASTPTPGVTEEEGPAELQIILTASSPCSDAPSSAAPSTPQTNQKGRPMLTGQEKTPISALLASIQDGFMFTPGTPVSPSAPYVARVKAAELDMDEVLGDRRDSWAETRHVLGLDDDEIPFGISGVFSKRGREREALSNVEVNN